jgi:hypothetical protein
MEPLGIDPAIPMPKLHAITLCRLAFPVDMQIDRHYCCGITIYRLAHGKWTCYLNRHTHQSPRE